MKKLLLASAAMSLLTFGAPALAADMPLKGPPVGFVPVFTWTSCYAGVHGGGGWARKSVTDPVALVQDQLNASLGLGLGPAFPPTTIDLRPNGYLVGGQFGCDYQSVGSPVVVGFEGAVSGGNINGQTFVGLPLGDPGDQALVFARMDFIASGTVRLGYAWDGLMLYVKGGGAGTSDKYSVSGVFMPISLPPGTPYNFQGLDVRIGWTLGAGIEWAFWENWSVKVEYDYYDFAHKSVLMSDSNLGLSAPIDIRQTVQTVKVGLNFHMWSLFGD